MFLSRSIKSLENLSQQSQDDGKIESKLVEIANSLLINYFIPTDSNFRPDLLPLIFQQVLPLTSDNMPVSVRVQTHSFLSRLCSLLTSFSPTCLLNVFDAPTLSGADGGGFSGYNSYGSSSNTPTKKASSIAAEFMMAILLLEPPAQASVLIFLTKLLHFLPPENRDRFIGTCHDLLLNSKPEILSKLTIEDWKILVNSFSVATLSTIVNFLINNGQIKSNSKSENSGESDENASTTQQQQKNVDENISNAIVIFLEKDPSSIMPLLLKTASLNFLCQFISLIPKYMHVPIHHLKDRILVSLRNHHENSNEASFALEITKIIMKRERFLDEKNDWIEIFNEIENTWMYPSLMISLKSSIIEFVSIAAEQKMLKVESLHCFFVFFNVEDSNSFDLILRSVPATILVSLLQLTSVYIKMTEKVPKGFYQFCMKALLDRDPLIYVAIIKVMTDCFNIMYKILPRITEKILNSCLNPLPKYFVEQIAVIRMIESIDFKETFPIEKLRYKLTDIIVYFLKTPHPSLLTEINEMIDKLDLNLPITEFDWFEQSSSLVYLLHSCNPFIILELLDYSAIPPSSFPVALSYLSDSILKFSNRHYRDDKTVHRVVYDFHDESQVIELSFLLFSRSLYVLIEAIKVLKLDIRFVSSLQKHHTTNEWEGTANCLSSLLDVLNESLPSTVFGKIISSCLVVISSTIKYLNFLSIQKATDIVKMATIFATAFTPQACKLVSEISQRVENSMNSHEPMNSQVSSKYQVYHQEIMKFFSTSFQFDYAVDVSLTAIECIGESDLVVVADYIRFASNSNRIVLLMNKAATESHFLDKKKSNKDDENDDSKNKDDESNEDDSKSFKSTLYNTFLAFKNDPDMHDYVSECVKEIPYEKWNIEEGDLLYIGKITDIKVNNYDVLDPIHKKAIKLHPDSFVIQSHKDSIDTNIVLEEISDRIQFSINSEIDKLFVKSAVSFEEDIPEVIRYSSGELKPFSPFKGFEPNPSLFYGFLWNSNRRLSDEDFMKAQEYAMSLNNTRINVSFLSYASRLNFTSSKTSSSAFVDVDKWVKLIKVDRFDLNSILSFCILSTFIRKSWNDLSEGELNLINETFIELGFFDSSVYNIVRIFKEEHGLNRMFAESVISIDPSRFEEFPLFSDIFLGRENFEQRFDDILNAIPSNIKKRRRTQIIVDTNPAHYAQSEIITGNEKLPNISSQVVSATESENIELIRAKSGANATSEKTVINNFVYSNGHMSDFISKENNNDNPATASFQNEATASTKETTTSNQDESNVSNQNESLTSSKDQPTTSNHKESTTSNQDESNVSNQNESTTSNKDESTTSSNNEQTGMKEEFQNEDEIYETSISADLQSFELNYEILCLFSRFLAPRSSLSKHEQFILPRGVKMIDDYYFPISTELEPFQIFDSQDSGTSFTSQEFEKSLHDKLISVFESSSLCDTFMFFVLFHLDLTEDEYQRCLAPIQRLTKSHPLSVHLTMADLSYLASFLDKSKNSPISQKYTEFTFSDDRYVPLSRHPSLALTPATSYPNCISNTSFIIDGNKPPSYTREFVSLLTSPHLYTNISMDDLITLSKSPNMKPVLFPLLVKGFEKFSIELFDFTSPLFSIPDEDYLLLTNVQQTHLTSPSTDSENNSIILTSDTLNKLKSYFSKVTTTTSIIAEEFFKMNPASLCKCFNTVSADAAFIEISEKLIDSVINSPSYLTVAVDIMKAIVGHTEIMQMCMIANSESFLNAEQFVCVFLIVKFVEKKLEKSDDAAFKEMWAAMKESLPEKVKDKQRLQLLTMKDTLEAFAKAFQETFD